MSTIDVDPYRTPIIGCFSTERVRELRRAVLKIEADLAEVSENIEDGDHTYQAAERYEDLKVELVEAQLAALAYAARGTIVGPTKDFQDNAHAIEIAMGDHDTDGGLD